MIFNCTKSKFILSETKIILLEQKDRAHITKSNSTAHQKESVHSNYEKKGDNFCQTKCSLWFRVKYSYQGYLISSVFVWGASQLTLHKTAKQI